MEEDPSRIRGLLFAIGEHAGLAASASESRLAVPLVRERFLGHDDAGVHAAAEWLVQEAGGGPPAQAGPLDPARSPRRSRAQELVL